MNMDYLPILYDILAAAFLLGYIYRASRRGFAATVVNFVGYLAALAVAWLAARALAPALFENLFRAGLVAKVEEALAEIPGAAGLAEAAAALLAALPAYLTGLLSFGGHGADELTQVLAEYTERSAETVVDRALAPALTGVLTTVLFMLLFSVLLVVLHAVVRGFEHLRDIPLVGPLNSVLGGVMGLLTGLVCLYVLVLLLELVLGLLGDSLSFLNQELLDRTVTVRLLRRFSPFSLPGGLGNL